MIKFENTETYGWKAAIRGVRNPMNSWDKSDTSYCSVDAVGECKNPKEFLLCNDCIPEYVTIGEKDLKLMKNLVKAGTDHSKFMRMITVTVDITAPMYWVQEHDTYKVGTVRNSCSFMHKGTSKPFEITDFSIEDERVYEILSPTISKKYPLEYPYETDKYKIYTTASGKRYKVYRNGKIYREEFETNEVSGRKRVFKEKEVKPSVTKHGYYEINIGGRNGEKWLLHRLVAYCWIENPHELETVNHINGNKGNNSVENLEWLSREDNIKDAYDKGLYGGNLKNGYVAWKNGFTVLDPFTNKKIKKEYVNGMTTREIAEKYDISYSQANNIACHIESNNSELYVLCLSWEKILEVLNDLRSEYLETENIEVFKMIRQMLPMGYNIRYTWQANYAVLRNIYFSRKGHKLNEWHDFCDWIKSLPYSELITEPSAIVSEWIKIEADEEGVYTGNLPYVGEEVLFCKKNGEIFIDELCCDGFDDDGNRMAYVGNGYDLGDIAAWMPPPKPYKARIDEEGNKVNERSGNAI